MRLNINNNLFKVPAYKVGDEVIFFSHISGTFAKGYIGSVSTYTDANQNSINYLVMLDEQKGVPNVPEALLFDSFKDAQDWINKVQVELMNM